MVEILSHFSFRKPNKSSVFWAFLFWAFSPMVFHTFSMRFTSGLYGGHFITAIPSASRKSYTVLALWQGALSCINIGVSTVSLRKWGRACRRKSSLQKLALILPWKQTMGLTLAEEIIFHTISLPPSEFHSFLYVLRR